MMDLPKELAKQLSEDIRKLEEERTVPYITSIERIAMEEGMEKGMEKGRQEGMERGKERGQLLGLAEGIAFAIEIKFGEGGSQLKPLLAATQDVERLREVESAIRAGASLEDVRALLES